MNYLRWYYKYHNTDNKFLKNYYFLRFKLVQKKFGAAIPITAKFGNNIIFPHGLYGIFVSKDAIIGNNCTIFHQVTIGRNDTKTSKKFGTPKIGDNVYIGCGAKIIGKVKIENNVRIGANCVVTNDIPSNKTVIMEKNRIIDRS